MKEKSKVILGQRFGNVIRFTKEEKLKIVEDFITGTATKKEVYFKYTGLGEEHGTILRWMREFDLVDISKPKNDTFEDMKKSTKPNRDVETFENLQLKKRVSDLEKQLKMAELKAGAFSLMVDIAEEKFNIPIRKKFNTKL
jgi:transposase